MVKKVLDFFKVLMISVGLVFLGYFMLRPDPNAPKRTSYEEFTQKYIAAQKECVRNVIGENTVYECPNGENLYMNPWHSRKMTLGSQGRNSGVYAKWGDKDYSLENTPFKIW